MNASTFIRAGARARPHLARKPLLRRTYADPVSDKIKLTLTLPHQVYNLHHPNIAADPYPSSCLPSCHG